jgi:tagaturonate reductase
MLVSEKTLQFNSEVIKNLDASAGGALAAKKKWYQILASASDPQLKTISYSGPGYGSNLLKEDIKLNPPSSFPGKLLLFLLHRFKYFKGDPGKGLTIISSKSINNRGNLEAIILELAHLNNLNPEFLDWIENSNKFI